MSITHDTVFAAIRADDELVEQLRRNRTSPPDCDPPSRRLAEFLSRWQREIDADPFPAILLDEAAAAVRRGAQTLPTPDGAAGPVPTSRSGSTNDEEASMLDSPTGPIERVEVDFRKVRPGAAAFREWRDSPLTDDPEPPNVVAVAFLLGVAAALVVAIVLVVAL